MIGRSASIISGDLSSLPDKHDPIVCAKDIFQDPYHTGMYFGAATKEMMQKWYDGGPASAAARTRPHAPLSPKMGPALVHQIIKWANTKISNRKKAIKGCSGMHSKFGRSREDERQVAEDTDDDGNNANHCNKDGHVEHNDSDTNAQAEWLSLPYNGDMSCCQQLPNTGSSTDSDDGRDSRADWQ